MSRGVSRGAVLAHVAVQLLAAALVFGAINFLGWEFPWRADWSRSQKFALAGQTKRVLRDLQKPVEVTVFFSRSSISPATALQPDVLALLDELIFSGRGKIRVEVVDPVRDLARAREVQARHRFRADENVVILEYDGRVAFVPVVEMADFAPVASPGMAPRVTAFRGEEVIVGALVGLMSPGQRVVYAVIGHGEPGAGDGTPISMFLDSIRRQNVVVRDLLLAGVDNVPDDAAALLIIGPGQDFSEQEIRVLSDYFHEGGSLLVLLDPQAATPRLDAFLASAGLRPRNDRVLRTVRLGFATGILREVTVEFSPSSPITRRMAGLTLFLPGQTQSLALEADHEGLFSLYPLLQPLEEFWGERDFVNDAQRGVRYEEGRDAGQPLFVGAATARGGAMDGNVEVGSSKLVVTGNSEFVLDAAISPSGLDFLVGSVNWLLDRGRLAATTPKVRRYFPLRLSDAQMSQLSMLALAGLPGAALIGAAFVWWQRRRS